MGVRIMSEKFSSIIAKFNSERKEQIITEGMKQTEIPRIQFSSPYMNYMTHGGFPRGRVVEFFGPESGGKTTTALDVVAGAQEQFKYEWEEELKSLEGATKKAEVQAYNDLKERGPLKCVYFDLEHTLDYDWAVTLGVNVKENFWVVDPIAQSAEELLDLMVELVKSKEVGLVVLDSIPYLVPQASINESLEKKEYGGVSKVLTAFLNRITPFLSQSTATLLVINQIRDSMNPYKLYDTPGGKALKFACSLRLMFNKGQLLDEEYEPTKRSSETAYGNEVSVKVEKTKICKPDRLLGKYTLSYSTGIEWVYDLAEILISKGLIVRAGAWYNFLDPETSEILEQYKSQGKTKAINVLKSNEDLLGKYLDYVQTNIIG